MKRWKFLMICAVLAASIVACKKNEEMVISNELNAADNNFILAASINNSFEIETSKIIVAKSTDSLMLSFAQYLLTEHTRAHDDLKVMGTIVGFTVSDSLDQSHTSVIKQLDSLAGRSLDSVYIHNQVSEHDTTLGIYRTEINEG